MEKGDKQYNQLVKHFKQQGSHILDEEKRTEFSTDTPMLEALNDLFKGKIGIGDESKVKEQKEVMEVFQTFSPRELNRMWTDAREHECGTLANVTSKILNTLAKDLLSKEEQAEAKEIRSEMAQTKDYGNYGKIVDLLQNKYESEAIKEISAVVDKVAQQYQDKKTLPKQIIDGFKNLLDKITSYRTNKKEAKPERIASLSTVEDDIKTAVPELAEHKGIAKDDGTIRDIKNAAIAVGKAAEQNKSQATGKAAELTKWRDKVRTQSGGQNVSKGA